MQKKTLTSKEDINIRGKDKSNLLNNLANIGFTRLPKHGSVRVKVNSNNSIFEPGYIQYSIGGESVPYLSAVDPTTRINLLVVKRNVYAVAKY